MQDLENKIGEIQVQAEYKLHLHDQDWAEKTKKMKEEMDAARGAAEARYAINRSIFVPLEDEGGDGCREGRRRGQVCHK